MPTCKQRPALDAGRTLTRYKYVAAITRGRGAGTYPGPRVPRPRVIGTQTVKICQLHQIEKPWSAF